MGNFRYRMLQFMIGRNGFDAFSRDLLFWAMILIFADIIIPGRIVRTIGIILMMYSYFRAFSRNTEKRSAENLWYISYVQTPFRSYMNRDRKNYKYFKCPACGQVLRAPKGRGRIRVTCSRCHNVFEKKI
ncbi:MAG: hypothetical protein UC708_07095 [Anaerovoracaceae bacterium]|nr:hypothetical protein [Bacillota bacterium]MEE0517629.1 hypothetical protein [Anaerovoracaceae bacterium]